MKLHSIKLLAILFTITTPFITVVTEPLPEKPVQSSAHVPTFVFDLNGVLFDTNTMTVLRQLGIKDVLRYLVRYRSPLMLKVRFYETLHRITETDTNTFGIKDPDGTIQPQLMLEWLRGTYTNKALLDRIVIAIKDNPHWFLNDTEQRLMAAMAHAIFDPEKFVASRKLLVDLVPLMYRLKKEYGAKFYVLSNWDKESFALLKERYPYLFIWFDGCIISGEVGHVKPEQEVFTKVPKGHICFLDDQQENLEASKKIGWHTILVNKTKSYFGLRSKIDVDTITKNAIAFLENKSGDIIQSGSQNVELSLPEQPHAAE